ncbi:hypothetical protein RN001_010649 [Aquatica leii]|uniref:MD-2-related lipid-recognition domain-containing protein n=1 Tax=Aquatica leii TaxID=1421715 RepID=A0AAN7SND9_9COLE|nr:hypothetical protein RN001_010649 [Aquatica leii]
MKTFHVIISASLIIASAYTQFQQNSYTIVHDRVDNIKCNKSILRRPDFKVLQYNDSLQTKVLNGSGTIRTTLTELTLVPTVYRFVSNAYRLFPINVTIDSCSPNKKNVLGLLSILNHTNYRKCPVTPGYYYLKYYMLEEDKFPPHIPYGQYKLSVDTYTTNRAFICSGDWYGSIVRKNQD